MIKEFGFEISNNNMLKDILDSTFVIGFNSSVLLESSLIKGEATVFKISDFNNIKNVLNVTELTLDKIFEKLTNVNDALVYNDKNGLIDDFKLKIQKEFPL
jgi:hypothetical protein